MEPPVDCFHIMRLGRMYEITLRSVCMLIPFNAGIDDSPHLTVQHLLLSAPGVQFWAVAGMVSNAADVRQKILKKLVIDA